MGATCSSEELLDNLKALTTSADEYATSRRDCEQLAAELTLAHGEQKQQDKLMAALAAQEVAELQEVQSARVAEAEDLVEDLSEAEEMLGWDGEEGEEEGE